MAKGRGKRATRKPYDNAIGHASMLFVDTGAQVSNLAVSLGEELQRLESSVSAGDGKPDAIRKSGSPISVRAMKSSVALMLSSMLEGWANFLAELALRTNDGLEGSPEVVHALGQAEIDCLAEQRTALDTRTAGLIVTKNVYVATLDKLVVVPRLLGRLHGFDFVLDKAGQGWQKVQGLKIVRDELTHPKLNLNDYLGNNPAALSLDKVRSAVEINMNALYECAEGVDWYVSQTVGLLRHFVKRGPRLAISFGSVEFICWLIVVNLQSPAGISVKVFNRHHPAPVDLVSENGKRPN